MKNLLLLVIVGAAVPALADELLRPGQDVLVNASGGPTQRVSTIVYDDTTTNLGVISSTNIGFVWGDDPVTTGGGTLEDFTLSIYNSGSSAGPLLTATVQVNYYDNTIPATPVWIGGFNDNISWTDDGLEAGYYSAVSWTALSGLTTPIVLPTNIIVTQKITAMTGTADRLGIVRAYPPSVGTSAAGYYKNGTWTTTEGAFYQIGVIPVEGACCFSNGACGIFSIIECANRSGTFQGAGTICTPNPCPQPGACCFPDGHCAMSTAVSPGNCAAGGAYQGDNTSCTPNVCPQPTGACCYLDGSCQVRTEAECAGTWKGAATLCTPNPCAPRVCLADANCDRVVSWRDIDYFVAGMNDNQSAWRQKFAPAEPSCAFTNLDVSGDGHVTWRDISPFVGLMNTTCP